MTLIVSTVRRWHKQCQQIGWNMPRKRIEDGPNELRIVRESRKLSQMTAAELVGVSRPMWSSWECRARQLTVEQLNMIQVKLRLTDPEVERIRKWWAGEELPPADPSIRPRTNPLGDGPPAKKTKAKKTKAQAGQKKGPGRTVKKGTAAAAA